MNTLLVITAPIFFVIGLVVAGLTAPPPAATPADCPILMMNQGKTYKLTPVKGPGGSIEFYVMTPTDQPFPVKP